MARRSQTPALSGANYRQFAALVLVAALGVALFGTSAQPAPEAQAPPRPVTERTTEASPEADDDTGGEFFAAEAQGDDFVPDDASDSADEIPAEDPSALAAAPGQPLPGSDKPADPGPTPEQIARLIEASRERSGARPGGD